MDRINIMVDTGKIEKSDIDLFDLTKGEKVICVPIEVTMLDLLVRFGFFPSFGQARKNWRGPIIIPDGWSNFIIGKKRRDLAIWKPSTLIADFRENG